MPITTEKERERNERKCRYHRKKMRKKEAKQKEPGTERKGYRVVKGLNVGIKRKYFRRRREKVREGERERGYN